ncbi:MAG: aminodeoxychorismate synthase, component I [Geobacteraceae bacterium GWC2_55_20]|nr:MAG: aminodeoxychorismate synthase, component I [Geobacteraceae bacterium GWC2_55_20]OGU21940.1 MAG: aminodeoxychorismate synthase, component I [Geobacteraceae bacterium GWF2_54_21]
MPDTPLVLLDSFGGHGFGSSWRFSGYTGTVEASTPDRLAEAMDALQAATDAGMYAAGFICYEAAAALNPDLPSRPPMEGLPLVWFAIFRERQSVPSGDGLPQADTSETALGQAPEAERYAADIERIRDYIAAGDCYQVNHTFQLQGDFSGDPLALYARIGRGQRAPFCAYIDSGRFTVVSASPELFFSLKDGKITTRPMKGTAPRGRTAVEDSEAVRRLRENPKERAENLMIVDLLRNDLGIVAETGSVAVESLFDIETYPSLHQMTSTVSARLRQATRLTDILRALFPCGSITGAPKRRSMEIIAGLEGVPRGVYCGAIGCIAPGGEALFSVAIRTLLLDRHNRRLSLGVGSGITWDSQPRHELAECLNKGAFVNTKDQDFQLIESLRCQDGACTLLERHLARLAASAEYFGFIFDPEKARQLLLQHAGETSGLCKLRLLLAADGTLRISSEALQEDASSLRLAISPLTVDSQDPFRYHKTTRRELLDQARAARSDCDEVLFLNERGEVTEGSYHTLVIKQDGRWLTPPLNSGLLPGVLREELLERGEITEKLLYPEDLQRADELWLVNSVRGRRRAVLVQGEPLK